MMWLLSFLVMGQGILLEGDPKAKYKLGQVLQREQALLRNRGVLLGNESSLRIPSSLDTPIQMLHNIYPNPAEAKQAIATLALHLAPHVEEIQEEKWLWHRAEERYSAFFQGKKRVPTDDVEHFEFINRGLQNVTYREFGAGWYGAGIYSAPNPYGAPGYGNYLLGIKVSKGSRFLVDNPHGVLSVIKVGPCNPTYFAGSVSTVLHNSTTECRTLLRATLKALGVVGIEYNYDIYNNPGCLGREASSAFFLLEPSGVTKDDVLGFVYERTRVASKHKGLVRALSHQYPDLITEYKTGLGSSGQASFDKILNHFPGCGLSSKSIKTTLTLPRDGLTTCKRVLPNPGDTPAALVQQWQKIFRERP